MLKKTRFKSILCVSFSDSALIIDKLKLSNHVLAMLPRHLRSKGDFQKHSVIQAQAFEARSSKLSSASMSKGDVQDTHATLLRAHGSMLGIHG